MKRSLWKTSFWCLFHPIESAKLLILTEENLDEYAKRLKKETKKVTDFTCAAVAEIDQLKKEMKELQQENEDLKDINMRIHAKAELLIPQGLHSKTFEGLTLSPIRNYRQG